MTHTLPPRPSTETTGKFAPDASTGEGPLDSMRIPIPDSTALSPLQQEALAWHVRRQGEAWQAADEQAFQSWLTERPAHHEAYARCAAMDRTLGALPPDAVARLRSRLAIDKARLGAQAEVKKQPLVAQPVSGEIPDITSASPVIPRKSRRSLVATGMAALAVGIGALGWHHQYAQPVFAQSYATTRGEFMDVSLPDGTRLQLDTATEVQVVYYRKRREVALKDGQAMFSVQPDNERPFHVKAAATRVTVVGTRFSVRHTPGQPGMEAVRVAVEEGKVRVARKPEGLDRWLPDGLLAVPGTRITAGQQLATVADGNPGPVRPILPEAVAPWREHRLSFVNQPLGQALSELERYADTGLVINDTRVATLPVSGTFDPRNVDALKRLLPRALPVRLVERGDKTELVSAR